MRSCVDASESSQETLEYLERANLFIVPLDTERRWYRYHHLFAELLRQRLQQSTTSSAGDDGVGVVQLHSRASGWYEDHGLDMEAFQHAAAANDIERAERLIKQEAMPLYSLARRDHNTQLAGFAAEDRLGCQALAVGEVCHVGADGRTDNWRRRETTSG